MSSQETSNETTSISQLSISEPISTKSIITEISYTKGSITPHNSTTSSKLDSPSSNKQPTATDQRANPLDLNLSFPDNFAANIQNTPDSVCQASEPRVATPTAQQMNGLSFSELCFLFCCPPLPRAIAAKLAFLPPEPSYSFSSISNANGTAASANNSSNLSASLNSDLNDTNGLTAAATNSSPAANNVAATPTPPPPPPPNSNQSYIEARLNLTTRAEWQYTPRDLAKIEVCWSRTSKNNRIACMYVKAVQQPKFVILFSHGNAIDLGQMSSFYLSLGSRINCNVFSYDYSGYGVSTGKPSEKNIYADIDCAWQTLRNKYGITPERIILYGQSIGTVPTVDLASRFEVAAVILHSPLMSGFRIFTQTKRTWFFDSFPTIDKVNKVRAPVLVIHGTDDEVIDISHGLAIYERCARAVEPLFVEGAGHNDVELYSQYLERLRDFINNDLSAPS